MSTASRRIRLGVWCGVLIFSPLLASCARQTDEAGVEKTTLTIGVPEAIAGADFGLRNVASTLSREGLTQLSPDGRPLPKLAESWAWDPGGLVLRMNLRKGVTFHDGTPLTAELAAGILRTALAKSSNQTFMISFADVRDIRANGALQLVFTLSRPSALLPEDLELPLEIGTPAIGTGAYRVMSSEPGKITLQANEDYYLGAPRIRQLIVQPFPALRTAWSSLLRGEVDMVTEVPPDAVEFVANNDVRVVSFARRYQYIVAFNSRVPPFDKPAVRRALNLAIDRDALVRDVLKGRGQPAVGPLWPQHWAYDASAGSIGFDPALAESLLDASGMPERPSAVGPRARMRFTCLIPANFSLVERLALSIQKQLYDVGVDVQFEVVSGEELDSRVRSGRFDAILLDIVGGPTFGRAYMLWGSTKNFQGLNVFGYENAEAERLFGVLRTTTSEGAVRSAARGLQRVLLDDPPALFLAWTERSRAVRRDFEIVRDAQRDPPDPLYSIWRWAPAVRRSPAGAP